MRAARPKGRAAAPLAPLLLLSLLLPSPAGGTPPVRVKVHSELPAVTLRAGEAIRLYAIEDQRVLAEWPGAREMRVARGEGLFRWGGDLSHPGPLRLRALAGPVEVEGRPYRGLVDLIPLSPGSFQVVNELDLESYLRGVLALEMGPRWPPEALKAQAVVSRTYVLWRKGAARSARKVSHLEADTLGQVYGGVAGESPGTDAAVAATGGEVLTHGGELARAYFHSTSDGWTEDASLVFGGDPLPYLRPAASPEDQKAPGFRWEATLSAGDVEALLSRNGMSVGRLVEILPEALTPSGRVASVRLVGSAATRTLRAHALRGVLGWEVLWSTAFTVRREGGSFRFAGRGKGHGVGMSQWGARFLAEKGLGYEEILRHYYPGTTLRRLAEP